MEERFERVEIVRLDSPKEFRVRGAIRGGRIGRAIVDRDCVSGCVDRRD